MKNYLAQTSLTTDVIWALKFVVSGVVLDLSNVGVKAA
jgi:hypothetical protein